MRRPYLLAASLLLASPTMAIAEDFKVVTEIFLDQKKVAETQTFFYGGRVYDKKVPAMGESVDLSHYDPARQEVVRINRLSKMRAKVTTEWLKKLSLEISARGVTNRAMRPLIEVQLKVAQQDAQSLVLSSEPIVYRVTTVSPKDASAVFAYLDFADQFAQINAVTPPNLPLFARMQLNSALRNQKTLPREIERTTFTRGRKQTVVAKQTYYWVLSKSDVRFCDYVGGLLSDRNYQDVSLTTFMER